MPKFTTGYTFLFAAGVCMVCSLGVATAAISLRPLQQANRKRDLQENILAALGLPEDGHDLAGEEIEQLYEARIEEVVIDQGGEIVEDATTADWKAAWAEVKLSRETPELLPVYQRVDDGEVTRLAIYMTGKGLWGPVSGYLAIDPEATTVKGATFFGPKETPGLGAEIQADWFKEQWKGKKIIGDDGQTRAIDVVKGKADEVCGEDEIEYCVDGISGSTLTGNGVDEMVDRGLHAYDPYLQRLRQQ